MYKILKYPFGYERGRPYAWCPEGQCIRIEYVEDLSYKGYWLWLIVDVDKPPCFQKRFFNEEKPMCATQPIVVQLGVLEEQLVETEIETDPSFVFIKEGKIYLELESEPTFTTRKSHHIAGYKTGQVIPYHPDNMKYLGFVPLVIKQEIAIYFFEVME